MEMLAAGEKVSSKQAVTHGSISERPTLPVSRVAPDQREQTPVIPSAIRERFTTPVGASMKATPGSTPRRPRRKFPGPAGLLPKLVGHCWFLDVRLKPLHWVSLDITT